MEEIKILNILNHRQWIFAFAAFIVFFLKRYLGVNIKKINFSKHFTFKFHKYRHSRKLTALKFAFYLLDLKEERYATFITVYFIFELPYLTKGNKFYFILGDFKQSLGIKILFVINCENIL